MMRVVAAVWSILVVLAAVITGLLTAWRVGPLTVSEGWQVALPAAALVVVMIAAGLAVTTVHSRQVHARAPSVIAEAAAAPPALDTTQSDHRDALVDLCIEISDRLDNAALLERLTRTLAEVGVEVVPSDGMVLDPEQHRVVDRVTTAEPWMHNHVASTERRGYLDHGRLIRPADVTVYGGESIG